jgi:hypothetical protein
MAVAALAVPAAAPAAAIGPDRPCARYIPTLGEPTWQAIGTGFTPSSVVTVRADDQVIGSGAADATGALTLPALAPTLKSANTNEQTFTLTAGDSAGLAATPSQLRVVRFGVDLPRQARPRSRVRYRAFGFAAGKGVYLHVRRGGQTRGRFSLGEAKGDCGKTSKRMRYVPLRRYRTGTYEYWFTQNRRFSRNDIGYRLSITVTRRIRTSSAASAATASAVGARVTPGS